MEKAIRALSVCTEDGYLCIDGTPPGGFEEDGVRIGVTPDQIDVLIEWLRQAKAELTQSG